MSEDRSRITVEIFGSQYKLKGNSSTNYMKMVAAHVNEHMHLISKGFPRLDIPRIAVLAAVHMADEFFKLQAEIEKAGYDQQANNKLQEDHNQLKKDFEKLEYNQTKQEKANKSNEELQSMIAELTLLQDKHEAELKEKQRVQLEFEQLMKNNAVQEAESEQLEAANQSLFSQLEQVTADLTRLLELQSLTEAQRTGEAHSMNEAAPSSESASEELLSLHFIPDQYSDKSTNESRDNNSNNPQKSQDLSALQHKYASLEDEYNKLKTEFNEWIQLVDHKE